MRRVERRYRHIARRLRRIDLQKDSSTLFDPDDIFASVIDEWSSRYFLGFYSEEGMFGALKRYGLFEELAKRGLHDPVLAFDLSDPYLHRLSIHCDGRATPDTRLMELRARVVHRPHTYAFERELGDEGVDFLFVEWLLLQHPRRAFSAERPPLPGQDHPGLGVAYEVFELLTIMAERLRLAGILNAPMNYHNALLYETASSFLDPLEDGLFRALRRDLAGRRLSEASWAVYDGCVFAEGDDQPFGWEGHEQLCALRPRVRGYLRSSGYRRQRRLAEEAVRFVVDEERLVGVLERRLCA